MNKIFRRLLIASLTISTTGMLWQMQALAEDQPATAENTQSADITTESTEMSQVTSVSQLSDVQPTDWGFTALQSLVERYGCIKGYPNQTFKGNRGTNRYEFAAGLNTCLNQINELIGQGTGDLLKQEDLVTIKRLQEEFGTELAQIRGRLDAVEARTEAIEANKFSPTSKLRGRLLTYAGDVFGKNAGSANKTTLGYQAIIGVNTSFTGKDNLGMSLLDMNTTEFTTAGNGETRLAGDIRDPRRGLRLAALTYQFPVGNQLRISVNPVSGPRILPESLNGLGLAINGTVSDFAAQNPLAYPVFNRTWIGAQWQPNKWFNLDLTAGRERNANDPTQGIFGGNGYLVSVRPTLKFKKFQISSSFIHSYSPAEGIDTWTGSKPAAVVGVGPVVANTYLASLNYRISPTFEFGGSVGRSFARALGTGTQGDADVLTYRFNLGMYDLGKKGNLAGIIFGMQPRLIGTSNDAIAKGLGLASGQRSDRSTGFHIEAFYTHRINNNITITPGIFWLTAPNHDDINPDVIVGVIRTAFTF
jgi:hypothetical protein